MAQNGGRIEFQVGVKQDQSSFKQLRQSLEQLSRIKIADFQGTESELQDLKTTASQVEQALKNAFNVNLNSVNISKFNQQIKDTVGSVDKIYTSFSKAGAQGQVAFSQMAREVLTTNLQLKQTNSLLDSMGTTMVNTVKWGIASSVMNTFTSSVQSAFSYVQGLEKSLTNIRIVTGDSTQKMQQFAVQANNAAQALGRSTMDYTKAALAFYQQGLDDQTVAARTDAVLKAQNITGAGQEMADYLTAVWNGYKVANEQAELYVDKLAAVADSSASNMSQLAIAMSKVASTANVMGVDVDQLNAQIATVVATTRQAPESVGTAFKTIYTRLNDIKAGAEDAEVSLGNYSGAMAKLGFNVLDAAGNLRDTGQVMDQIGESWQNLSREQQVFLARTMGGQRQITQVMALFDNWNKYTQLLNTSLQSEGTLMEKNGRYMESLGAKMEQLGAAGERVKNSLIDSDSFKAVISLLTSATNLLGSFIESIGGGGNALLGLGSIATQVFGKQIANQINNVVKGFQSARENAEILKQDIQMTKLFGQSQGYQEGTIKQMIDAKEKIQQYYSVISAEQIESYNNIVKEIGASKEQVIVLQEQVKTAEAFSAAIQKAADEEGVEFSNRLIHITDHAENLKAELDSIRGIGNLAQGGEQVEDTFDRIANEILQLRGAIDDQAIPAFRQFDAVMEEPIKNSQDLEQKFRRLRQVANEIFNQVYQKNGLVINLDEIKAKTKQTNAELQLLRKKADEVAQGAKQIFDIKNITQMISSVGQLASGFNILSNVVNNVWTNENLSAGEKALKTIMSMTTALPMLINGYNLLKKSMGGVSTLLGDLAQKWVSSKKMIYDETDAVETLMAAQQEATLRSGALVTALGKFQILLAGATPYVIGFLAFASALSMIRSALDKDIQALEKFNQKQKEFHSNDEIVKGNVSELQKLKEEYEELAKKANASNFDSNIDSLTEQERARYNQIKELVASYNEDAVAGYNDQHEAILVNNQALEDTIKLLKEKHQLEIDEVYGGKQYKKSYQNKRQSYLDSRRESLTPKNFEQRETDQASLNALSQEAISALKWFQGNSDVYSDTFEDEINKIIEVKKEGLDKLWENDEELAKAYNSAMAKIKENPAFSENEATVKYFQDNLKKLYEISKDYRKAEFDKQEANKDLIESAKIPIQEMIAYLQTNSQNEEYNKLAQEYGQETLDSIITSYVQGVNQAGDGFTYDKFESPEQYAKKLKQGILQPLLSSQLTSDDISQIQKVSQDFNKTAEGLTLENYHKTIVGIVQGLYNENENLRKMADQNPEIFSNLVASLFGLDSVDIKFNDGKVEVLVNSMVDIYSKARDEAKEKISKLSGISDENRQILNQYVDNANNYSLKNFDQLLDHMDLKAEDFKNEIKETAEQLNNISHLQLSTTAFDLINKRDSGSKLTEKQAGVLVEELDSLAAIYPGLTDQIKILNEEELKGTAEYQKALFSLKATIFETFAQVGDYSDSALENISNVVHSMEDLQMATTQNPSLFQDEKGQDTEWYRDQLAKLATQYQSCTDELNEYLRVGGDAARLQLQLAVRAEQSASKYGIAADRISDLSQHFMELARAGQEGYQGLQNNSELATDAAIRYIRLNDSLADLYDNLDNYKKVQDELKDSGNDLADVLGGPLGDAFRKIKQDVAGIADVDVSLLKDSWIADNMKLIMEAAEGGQEAINRLQQAAAQQILLNLDIDYSQLDEKLGQSAQAVAEWAKNLEPGELSLNDTLFVQQLVTAMQVAGQSQQEIESILSGLGINVDLVPYQEGLNKAIDDATKCGQTIVEQLSLNAKSVTSQQESTDTVQQVGFSTDLQAHTEPGTVPVVEQSSTEDGQPTYTVSQQPTEFTVYGYKATPEPVQETQTKQNTAMALEVQGANKKAGGKISHYNTSGARKARAAKSSGTKKSTPKKSSAKKKNPVKGTKRKLTSSKKKNKKKETQKDPEQLEKLEEEKDRYHDINIQITKIEHRLTEVQEQQKKLTGKDLINNLEKQLEILNDQVKAHKEKLSIAKQEQSQLQNKLRGYGVTFDQSGAISNYASVLESQLAKVNRTIEKYNNMSAKQQEDYKDKVQSAKKRYETLKDLIERYDTVFSDLIPELKEAITSDIDKQIEIQIEKFKVNVQLELDFSEALRNFNKFKKQIIDQIRDDDIPGIVRSQIQDIYSYYSNSEDRLGSIPALTDQVNGIMSQLKQIDSTGWSDIYGNDRAKALEDLKEYSSKLMSQLQNVDDLIKDIKQSFFDMTKQAQSAFDEQSKQYDFLSQLIDHDKKLVEMLYGDKAYTMISNYYQKQEQVDKKELDFQRQQKDFWYAQMQAQKQRMDTLDKESNEYKEVEQRFKDLEEHWLSAVSDFNSKVEESVSNLLDQYKNNVSIIFDDLSKKLTGGKGLDYVNEEWELINNNADMYLDKINSMYQIEKLQQAYEDAIADAGNDLNAQKSLNDMMNQQLKYLRQKDKLTQYDVDRANLLLQLQTKRLALEQARQSKTKLRLRRDSQGNYTYQYVADEQQTNQAERGLAQVQNSIYNLDKNEYKSNLNSIYSLQTEFNDKMQALYEEYPVWTEQAEMKRRLLVEKYGQAINHVVDQNEKIRLNLTESAFTELAKMYDTDVSTFKNMSQAEQEELMRGLVPQWDSGIQEMADKFAGQGGFIPTCTGSFKQLDEATDSYEKKLDQLQKIAGVDFESIGQGLDSNIEKAEELVENNDALITKWKAEADTVSDLIDTVNALTKAYEEAKTAAIAAATAAQKQFEAENKNKSTPVSSGIDKVDTSGSDSKKTSGSDSTSSTGSDSSTSIKGKLVDTKLTGKLVGINGGLVAIGTDETKKTSSLPLQTISGIAAAASLLPSQSGWGMGSALRSNLLKKFDTETANKIQAQVALHGDSFLPDSFQNQWKAKMNQLEKYYFSRFDTGGYTGEWVGDRGKLAILHEKELVLNKKDTANLLSAVNIVRTMDKLLENISGKTGLVNSFAGLGNSRSNSSSSLDQNVHITATFPNVTQHTEIEKAFDNLISRASQYAFR